MHRYVARRLLMLIPMLIGVSLVVFIIMRLIPGDIASIILMGPTGESGADPKALAELRHKLGLDQPLPLQYLTWVAGLARLDAGNSLWSDRPVFAEILERLPLTVELSLMAIAASLVGWQAGLWVGLAFFGCGEVGVWLFAMHPWQGR